MKNLFFGLLIFSQFAFGITGNKVWRVPSGQSLGAWGPIQLGDNVNAVSGALAIANGGSGQVTSAAALTAFLPAQSGQSGKYLQSNGSSTSWQSFLIVFFGDGSDGNLTVTSNSTNSGPLTSGALTRDAYFNNLTINGSGAINTSGFRIFVAGTLDISAAGAGAIYNSVASGHTATSSTGDPP